MPLNPSLLLFETLIVDRPDCTDFLHSLGLSLVPVLAFATAGSKMVGWANGVLRSQETFALFFLYFLETFCNAAKSWKTVKLKLFPN